jgi:hypothetical protein
MADLTQQLADMIAQLNIVGAPVTANPGQAVHLGLAPPPTAVSFTDIIDRNISVSFIAKDVVFTRKDFASPTWLDDPAIAKVLPFFNLTAVPPTADPSGVPGVLAHLTGVLPVAVPSVAAPRMTVAWTVTDDAGMVLVESTDFLAPGGLDQPTVDITFLPAFVRFDGTAAGVTGRKIKATVTLTAGTSTRTADVGPVRVLVPVIPFPKVLALTIGINFLGPAIIVVPDVSPIVGIDHLRTLLQPVRNAVSALTSITRFAEMLVGIDTVSGILNAANIVFVRQNPVNNLNDFVLVARPWYENDTEAEDELQSFVYIAPPPSTRLPSDNKVEMCNNRFLLTDQGKFTVNTGPGFVASCANLNSGTPTVSPSTAALVVNNAAGGYNAWNVHFISTFGSELSSINFL